MALDVEGTTPRRRRWFRHGVHGADPRSRRQPPAHYRWQRGTVVEALYLADSEPTVWAEWYRALAEAGIPPNAQMPRDLWTWEVDPGLRVADLTTAERLRRVGLAPPRPARSTWPRFQAVGEALWREGWRGLLAPSAARPEGLVLCLFRTADGVPAARPRPPARVVREPPAPPRGMTT